MALNYIWIAFFLLAFVVALVKLVFLGDTAVFPEIINSTFASSKTAFEISLGLTGVLSLWLGIMKIGEKGGVIQLFARLLSPLFSKLFPEIPKGHPVTGSIFMNLAANMLGLDNAATPLGLKAMEGLQELNPRKDTASNPMIMFLVLNTSGLTLIPISIMVYRAQMGAAQPTDVFVPILLATFFSTMAGIIANELGVNLRITSGPAIERPGDLAALLTNLQERDLLFIDEIHRLSHSVEEVLYAAMEDYALDIVIGKGPSARSVRIDLPPFTLVGATTQVGRLAPPLRDRFGVICRLEFYRPEELVLIIKRTADILNVEIDDAGALEVARRSRGTPRIANRLLKRVRDFAQVAGEQTISSALAGKALDRLEVDACGLDRTDRRVLQVIIEKFGGGPVGLDTIAAAISESVDAVEDVYEPFLMQLGFLNRTPRGRVVTEAAYAHLGLPSPSEGKGSSLF